MTRQHSQTPAAIRMRAAYMADPDVFRRRARQQYRKRRNNGRHDSIVAAYNSGEALSSIRERFGLTAKQLAGHASRAVKDNK